MRNDTVRLNGVRKKIDTLDDKIFKLIAKRFSYSAVVANCKKSLGMPLLQKKRLNELLKLRNDLALELNIDRKFAKKLIRLIHDESLRLQKKSLRKVR